MCDEKKAITDINTDGKERYDWETKYHLDARKQMKLEAAYLVIMMFLSFIIIIFNYLGILGVLLKLSNQNIRLFKYIIYFSSAGLLGGVILDMKYFYRTIARGYWSQDRVYWRMLIPLISLSVAFIVGCMFAAGILSFSNNSANTWALALGFFAGYFADQAVGKMYEIAVFLFGKTRQ